MTKNSNNTAENLTSLIKKLQSTYLWASLKDIQAAGEAFSPQNRTSSTSKNEVY
jgi:hypothetical protein